MIVGEWYFFTTISVGSCGCGEMGPLHKHLIAFLKFVKGQGYQVAELVMRHPHLFLVMYREYIIDHVLSADIKTWFNLQVYPLLKSFSEFTAIDFAVDEVEDIKRFIDAG